MKRESMTYGGHKIFIGIDVHKKYYVVTCLMAGEIVKRCRLPANPQTLVMFCQKHFPGAEIYSTYEAGFSGYMLHRCLQANGIHNIVVHPAAVEIAARDRVKTDKRDSSKLAIQLSAGRLRGIRVPSEQEELRRLLTRTREQLVRTRTQLMNQIRMKAHQFGLIHPDNTRRLSRCFVRGILQANLPPELRVALESLFATWIGIDTQLNRLDEALKTQATQDPLEGVYRSLPGVGPRGARVLANELGELNQFPNEKRLFSFTGLTPGEFSSGERRRLGHISRQGAGRLRHVLIESAWVAIRKDPALAEDFERIAARVGKKRAIVAIARKLIGRARALFRTGAVYEVGHRQAA